MPNPPDDRRKTPPPWHGTFCARDDELKQIRGAWDQVAGDDPRPQTVVLLGEAGLGKTRIIQEFYHELATTVDASGADGYWPDALAREGDNLRLNPEPSACRVDNPPPFLWWGLRLHDPDRANAGRTGASNYLDFLKPHLEPFVRSRVFREQLEELGAEVAKEVATKVLSSLTFDVLGHAKTFWGIGVRVKDTIESSRTPAPSPHEAQEWTQKELAEQLLHDFTTLLDVAKGKRLPIVLVVDDAHHLHADPTTREFVEQLLPRAQARNWPLLVLASHWEREWHDDQEDQQVRESRFANLCTRERSPARRTARLSRHVDLGAMIDRGLPGLTAEQRQGVAKRAGGNPRLLDEILRYLRRNPKFFTARDIASTLTAKGEREVERATFGLHELIADRLAQTDDAVRIAIGLSSLQGERFLTGLTHAIAEDMEATDDTIRGLTEAERPHAMVQGVETLVAEFAQRVYHEVARDDVDNMLDGDEAEKILCEHLRAAVEDDERRAGWSETEREATLALAMVVLAEDDPLVALRARADHVGGLMAKSDHLAAATVAAVAAESAALEDLDFERLWTLCDAAYAGSDFKAMEVFARSLRSRALAAESTTPSTRQNLSVAMGKLGDITHALHGPKAARPHYVESLKIRRALATELATSQAWRDLAIALDKFGNVEHALRGPKAAWLCYVESLKITCALAAKIATPEVRRDFAIALSKFGDVEHALRGPEAARPHHAESLEITRALADEFATLQARRDLAIALSKFGDVEHALRGPEAARPHHAESLEIAHAFADEFASPQSRRDLYVALISLGNVERALCNPQAARPHYAEALEIARELGSERATPGARRDLSVVLEKLGDIEHDLRNLDVPSGLRARPHPRTAGHRGGGRAARPHYEESLEIRRDLAAELATPRARLDLAVALIKLGDVENVLRGSVAARPHYEESLEIARALVAELATTQERQHLAVALERVGDLRGPLAARPYYEESLELRRALAAELATPEARRYLSVALEKFGSVERALRGSAAAWSYYKESLDIACALMVEQRTILGP